MANSLKFGVWENDGRRSSIWTLTVNEKIDDLQIYLTSKLLSKSLKMTYHDSGDLKVSFHGKPDETFREEHRPADRDTMKWNVGNIFLSKATVLARVAILNSSLKTDNNPMDRDVLWLYTSGKKSGLEILVITTSIFSETQWPLMDRGASLLASYEFNSGDALYVVAAENDFEINVPTRMPVVPLKNSHFEDILKANTAIMWSKGLNNEVVFIESDISVEK